MSSGAITYSVSLFGDTNSASGPSRRRANPNVLTATPPSISVAAGVDNLMISSAQYTNGYP